MKSLYPIRIGFVLGFVRGELFSALNAPPAKMLKSNVHKQNQKKPPKPYEIHILKSE